MKIVLLLCLLFFVGAILVSSSPPSSSPSTLPVITGEIIAGFLAYEFMGNIFVLFIGLLIIVLLIKVKATKWLFMSLLAGALWLGVMKGTISLLIVIFPVALAILGIFGFFFSRSWSHNTEYDQKGKVSETESSQTNLGFNGDNGKN